MPLRYIFEVTPGLDPNDPKSNFNLVKHVLDHSEKGYTGPFFCYTFAEKGGRNEGLIPTDPGSKRVLYNPKKTIGSGSLAVCYKNMATFSKVDPTRLSGLFLSFVTNFRPYFAPYIFCLIQAILVEKFAAREHFNAQPVFFQTRRRLLLEDGNTNQAWKPTTR